MRDKVHASLLDGRHARGACQVAICDAGENNEDEPGNVTAVTGKIHETGMVCVSELRTLFCMLPLVRALDSMTHLRTAPGLSSMHRTR
jgi:hypothetical protein